MDDYVLRSVARCFCEIFPVAFCISDRTSFSIENTVKIGKIAYRFGLGIPVCEVALFIIFTPSRTLRCLFLTVIKIF